MSAQRRNTRQRKLVLDAVRATDSHPTADDIYIAVREKDEHISRGTVYRNLNLLSQEGVIQQIKAPGGSRFDWRTDGHAHVACTTCGAVVDFMLAYDTELDALAQQETGYDIDSHYTIFEGLCPTCQNGAPGDSSST